MSAVKHIWVCNTYATLTLVWCGLIDLNIELITIPWLLYFLAVHSNAIFWTPKLRWYSYPGTSASLKSEILKGLGKVHQGHLLSFVINLTLIFSKLISKGHVFPPRTGVAARFHPSQIQDRCCSGDVLAVYEFPLVFMPLYAVCVWSLIPN